MMARDLTQKQFEAALKRNDIGPRKFFGYHDVGHSVSVSALNAGDRRRDQLAYLIKQKKWAADKYGKGA